MTLQFISHFTERLSYLDSVRIALDGGCRWVQLRMKDAAARELCETAAEAVRLCHAVGAKLIVDDRLDVALAVGADGVHLGQKDLPVARAREIAGAWEAAGRGRVTIGGTANTFEEVLELAEAGADYAGVGPFRFTTTKKGLAPVLGLEGYRSIVSRARERGLVIPIIAIGGITRADIPDLARTGIDGIALSGGILRAEDPVEEMRLTLRKTQAEP